MVQVSELKANVSAQFRTSLDILDVAKDLNVIRRRLEDDGRAADAEAMRQAILRLVDQSEKLIDSARASGKSVADALRESW